MGVDAPYLFGAGSSPISVHHDVGSSITILGISGTWDQSLWHQASTAMRKCLAESPAALIVELSHLHDPAAESAPTWLTAQKVAAGMAPPVQLALVVPPDLILADRMQRMGAPRFLPVFAKVRQAAVAVQSRLPLTERLTLQLTPGPEAPGRARDLVGDACRAWHLPVLLPAAADIVTELVGNAVQHTGTPVQVVVSKRGTGLHLAVIDGDPRLPELLPDGRGGLRMVHTAATVWGSMPTHGGKVVWATIRPHEGIRRPRA